MPEPQTRTTNCTRARVRPDRGRVQPVRHGPACGGCCLPARPSAGAGTRLAPGRDRRRPRAAGSSARFATRRWPSRRALHSEEPHLRQQRCAAVGRWAWRTATCGSTASASTDVVVPSTNVQHRAKQNSQSADWRNAILTARARKSGCHGIAEETAGDARPFAYDGDVRAAPVLHGVERCFEISCMIRSSRLALGSRSAFSARYGTHAIAATADGSMGPELV